MQCPERDTLGNPKTSLGGVIRDLMGAKTERLILAFSFGVASLRALHQARVCTSSCLLQKAPPRLFLRLSPLEARRVGAPRRVGARASRRRTERRGSTAQRAIPPPLLDLGHRPVGWGTRRHLRRHAVVRRESPRCQTSCAPDGHAWGVVAPRGVPARGGCGGGLVGSQEDCALLASWPGRCGGRPPM